MTMTMCGCVDINGGAVEVVWQIQRRSDGHPISCEAADIASMQLLGVRTDGVAGADIIREWPCDAGHGATSFDVTPGRYAFTIKAVCTPPHEVDSQAQAPAPIVRDVSNGDVVSLNALQIITNTNGIVCCTGMTCLGTVE